MTEHVVLVAGAPGAGTTAAITTAGRLDAPQPADDLSANAVDYGEIGLGPRERVRLYGVPAGTRYDFMWQILRSRAAGLLILVRHDRPDPRQELLARAEDFREIVERGGAVVGVTHTDVAPLASTAELQSALAERFPTAPVPVFTLDPRDRAQLVTILSVLAANLDGRAMLQQG